MDQQTYRGRRAAVLENETTRVSVILNGGHIAEFLHKRSGVNPLWSPPWPSIDPSSYDPQLHSEYGTGAEAKLLAGILGHNLCLDIFGGPSEQEAVAGLTVHGEASIALYELSSHDGTSASLRTLLKKSHLIVTRDLRLDGCRLTVVETVENLLDFDRPLGWTQHVTLGSPLLTSGDTSIDLTAGSSRTYEERFGNLYASGQDFHWPLAPGADGGTVDLRRYPDSAGSAGYTAHLMDDHVDHACFAVASSTAGVAFGYRWRRPDFPWCGMWIENRSRTHAPWAGQTVALGMEFGVSPMPETRRKMVERGSLFNVPAYRWLPAAGRLTVRYEAAVADFTAGSANAREALGW